MPRYEAQDIILNGNRMYKEHFYKRGVSFIKHLSTVEFKYPSPKQLLGMGNIVHIWKMGDRYYKLAHYHYGDPTLWWVIAWMNKAPTEAHIEFGDEIMIPLNLEIFLQAVEA